MTKEESQQIIRGIKGLVKSGVAYVEFGPVVVPSTGISFIRSGKDWLGRWYVEVGTVCGLRSRVR